MLPSVRHWIAKIAIAYLLITAIACGGGGGGAVIPNYPTKEVSLQLALPSAIPTNSINLLSANTQVLRPSASAKVRVGTATPTIVLISDSVSNSLVAPTVADPRLETCLVNTKSIAGAVLYLGVGASQFSEADRIALWDLIFGNAATDALASKLATKLAANRFAYRDADSELKAAIQTAIDTIRAAFPGGSAKHALATNGLPSGRSRGVPSPADPPVLYTLPDLPLPGFGQVMTGKVNGKQFPDYIAIRETTLRSPERTAFLIPGASTTGRITDTLSLPEVRGFTEVEHGPFSSPTTSTSPLGVDYAVVHPIFDAPDLTLGSLVDPADLDTIENARKLLWKKAVVRFSSDIILEVLGFGGTEYTPDQLTALTNAFAAVTTEFGTIVNASADGKNFVGHIEAFVTNASSTDDQIRATYTVLKSIVPDLHFLTPERLVVARAALASAINQQIVRGLGTDGPMAQEYKYNGENPSLYSNLLTLTSTGLKVQKYTPVLDTTATNYTPGGAPIQINVRSTGDDYITKFADVLVFKWKVFGDSGATLTAGSQTGTEFETTNPQVIFQATSAASGAQNVGVEVYLKNGSAKRLYGKSTIILNDTSGGNVVLAGGPVSLFKINFAGNLTVTRNGQLVTSWPGYNSANLRFEWSLNNSDAGTFMSNGTPTTSLTTTTASVPFKSADADHGTESTASVTIKAVDPVSGSFTVLASASSIVRLHVLSGCRVALAPTFSPSQLEYDSLVRNGSNIGTNSISFIGGHYFANGSFSNSGSRDTFSTSVDLGTNPKVGDIITFASSGSTSFLQQKFYFTVNPFVGINNASANVEIMEIMTRTDGTPKYFRLRIRGSWTTNANTMGIESVIDAGFGSF